VRPAGEGCGELEGTGELELTGIAEAGPCVVVELPVADRRRFSRRQLEAGRQAVDEHWHLALGDLQHAAAGWEG